jgi:prepilin-type N-terminal cleavage/methylation domain-containing protein
MRTHLSNSGFSLIETIVALSLLSIFVLLEIPASLHSYGAAVHRADMQLLISALREARAQSLSEVCKNPHCTESPAHGVYFNSTQLTVFEGGSYATRYRAADIPLTFSLPETMSASTNEIIFAATTGDTLSDETVAFIEPNQHTRTISINSAGMISP